MEFIDVLYMFITPLVLVIQVFGKGKLAFASKQLQVVLNTGLFFFFLFQCYQYYQLYQFADYFGMAPTFTDLFLLAKKDPLDAFYKTSLLLFPLFLSITALRSNVYATLLMLCLFWCKAAIALVSKQPYTFTVELYKNIPILCLQALSLFIGITGLLVLLKKVQLQYEANT